MKMFNVLESVKKLTLPLSPKILQKILYAFFVVAAVGIFINSLENGMVDYAVMRHEMGELSWKLLLFTLFISLFQKIFPSVKLLGQLLFLRKDTGVAAFFFALAHGIFHFLAVGFSMEIILFTISDISLSSGAIALFILLILTLTSTHFAMKKMGPKKWKMLQRFAHIAFWLVGIHIFFITGKDFEIFAPFIVYILGYLYLWGKKQ